MLRFFQLSLKVSNICKSPYFQLHIIIVKQYLTEQNLSGFCSISMQKKGGMAWGRF